MPTTTDADHHISQAEKHMQIGTDAATKLLQAVVTGLQPASRKVLFIIDLSSHTAELMKAFVDLHGQWEIPAYYFGLCEDEVHMDWVTKQGQGWAKAHFLDGNMKIPNFMLPPATVPTELVAMLPPKPTLTTMLWSAVKDRGVDTLIVPDAIMTHWHDHGEHGAAFRAWLDEATVHQFVNQKIKVEDASQSSQTLADSGSQNSAVPAAGIMVQPHAS